MTQKARKTRNFVADHQPACLFVLLDTSLYTLLMKCFFRASVTCLTLLALTCTTLAEPHRGHRRPRRHNPSQHREYSDVSTVTLRLGVPLGGFGDDEERYNRGIESSINYDDISGPLIISSDILYNIHLRSGAQLRLGLGLSVLPMVEIDDGVSDFSFGTELDTMAVFESVFPISYSVGILGRGFLGPAFLFPGGDWGRRLDEAIEDVPGASNGPFLGITGGLGFGTIFRLNHNFGLRAELLWQAYHQPYYSVDFGRDEESETLTGHRFFFMAGVEF